MEKTCLSCAISFNAKRSDAIYCSSECKNKANYKKSKPNNANRQQETNLNLAPAAQNENTLVERSVEIKGSLSVNDIRIEINKSEAKIEHYESRKTQLNALNEDLLEANTSLSKKVSLIENLAVKRLQNRLALTDGQIYNGYLNKAYINALKEGNEFAHNRMIHFEPKNIPDKYRHPIVEYRLKISNAIMEKEEDVKSIHTDINRSVEIIDTNQKEIKNCDDNIRYYQSRIIKYDSLLLSV